MTITVEIKNCSECRHINHTGAFTHGGAKPCCNHPDTIASQGYSCFDRVVKYKTDYSMDRPVRVAKGIADFCPLKTGAKY